MNYLIPLAALVGGIILLTLGVIASDSLASDFSKFFTGSPTDRSIWMIIGGVLLIALSGLGLRFWPGAKT